MYIWVREHINLKSEEGCEYMASYRVVAPKVGETSWVVAALGADCAWQFSNYYLYIAFTIFLFQLSLVAEDAFWLFHLMEQIKVCEKATQYLPQKRLQFEGENAKRESLRKKL